MTAKSTRQTEESETLLVIADWLKNGIPDGTSTKRPIRDLFELDAILYTIREGQLAQKDAERIVDALKSRGLIESATFGGDGKGSEQLMVYLTRFWNYDTSPYVREKLAFGDTIGRRHCYEESKRLRYWREFFGEDTRLRDVTRDRLKEFQLQLHDKGLAPKTINATVAAGTVALKWATAEGILAVNPSVGLRKLAGESAKRGILTSDEVRQLFEIEWTDERARVGNLVAATCGLRAGEVLALRVQDIGEDRLRVEHSYSRKDGLKRPKNREIRRVPLLPAIRDALLNLSAKNPHGSGPTAYLFFSVADSNKPVSDNLLRDGLYEVLVNITLNEDDRPDSNRRRAALKIWREDRGITFHS